MGYRVINMKSIDTGEQIKKKIPIHGKDELATVYDPLIKISVLITKS
jgi:hypothetical protein